MALSTQSNQLFDAIEIPTRLLYLPLRIEYRTDG